MHKMWNYFEETGNIEAYLLYLEYKKILDGEYADEIIEKVETDERKNEGIDSEGDQHGRSGQNPDNFD